jgi:hypothetical protein
MNWTDRERTLLAMLVSLGLAVILATAIYSHW